MLDYTLAGKTDTTVCDDTRRKWTAEFTLYESDGGVSPSNVVVPQTAPITVTFDAICTAQAGSACSTDGRTQCQGGSTCGSGQNTDACTAGEYCYNLGNRYDCVSAKRCMVGQQVTDENWFKCDISKLDYVRDCQKSNYCCEKDGVFNCQTGACDGGNDNNDTAGNAQQLCGFSNTQYDVGATGREVFRINSFFSSGEYQSQNYDSNTQNYVKAKQNGWGIAETGKFNTATIPFANAALAAIKTSPENKCKEIGPCASGGYCGVNAVEGYELNPSGRHDQCNEAEGQKCYTVEI